MPSKIQWTDETWNPASGCTKISPGCKNCYAERQAIRLKRMLVRGYRDGFKVTCHPYRLNKPFKWLKPRMVFVNSMGDLFHDDVPEEFILQVFDVMNQCPQHTFQILTKRPERLLLKLNKKITWTDNIWMGVSIESLKYAERAIYLSCLNAKIKFISFEPLIGEIFDSFFIPDQRLYPPKTEMFLKSSLYFKLEHDIDWVIVGGETGPGARRMDPIWAAHIGAACERLNVPFFFKQVGHAIHRGEGSDLLHGKSYKQMPDPIQPGRLL